MKIKKLLAGIITSVICLTSVGFNSVHADTGAGKATYTAEDLKNMTDFLLGRKKSDLKGKSYDLNNDGRLDVFDLCMMRNECINSSNQEKTLVVYYSLVLPDDTDASASASRVIVDGKPYGTTEYMAKVIHRKKPVRICLRFRQYRNTLKNIVMLQIRQRLKKNRDSVLNSQHILIILTSMTLFL